MSQRRSVPRLDCRFYDAVRRGLTNQKIPPIYYFFDVVAYNEKGDLGDDGDKHYKCRHGAGRVLTVTRKMKATQTGKLLSPLSRSTTADFEMLGLVTHLQNKFPEMYSFWKYLKSLDRPASDEEILMAQGKKALSPEKLKEMTLEHTKLKQQSLAAMFARQEAVKVRRTICLIYSY